jgi:F-type H+-transporting ATPase subunit a
MITEMAVETASKAGHESLGEELTNVIQVFKGFDIHIGNLTINVSETTITMWVIMFLVITAAFIFTRRLNTFPSKIQNVVELIVESINSLTKSIIGHHWRSFAPYFGTVIIFLAIANTIAMFGIPALRPPTKDINVTASLAIMSIILVLGSQLKYKKLSGTIKSLFQPLWIMFPFKILEYFIRPLSLCLRLFGNIFGAFVMMELIITVSHRVLLPTIFSLYFDIFDGLLQAFIFVFLTMLYVGEAIE